MQRKLDLVLGDGRWEQIFAQAVGGCAPLLLQGLPVQTQNLAVPAETKHVASLGLRAVAHNGRIDGGRSEEVGNRRLMAHSLGYAGRVCLAGHIDNIAAEGDLCAGRVLRRQVCVVVATTATGVGSLVSDRVRRASKGLLRWDRVGRPQARGRDLGRLV